MSTQETLIQDIESCTVQGNIVSLPPQDQPLNDYANLKKALINAGGKYKRNTFVFTSDAQPFLDRLTGGESVNIKKEFQFFETPDDIADWLVQLANIKSGHNVLEPSAGQGAIIRAIRREHEGHYIECFELMPENAKILNSMADVCVLDYDFIDTPYEGDGIDLYDRIVANPPFSKNQDIEHIMKMYDVLKKGGRLVSVASKHWQISDNSKEKQFRSWLDSVDAEIHKIEAGGFKASGTMISTCVIVIDKQ